MNWYSPISIIIIALVWELFAGKGKINIKSFLTRIAGTCLISALIHMATSCQRQPKYKEGEVERAECWLMLNSKEFKQQLLLMEDKDLNVSVKAQNRCIEMRDSVLGK